MTKRISAIFLTIVLFVSSLTVLVPVYAVDSSSCGANAVWAYDSETATLTVSGSGEMENYAQINITPWKTICTSVKKIVISEGITSVGDYAFPWFTEVTEIVLPQSLLKIGTGAFGWCYAVKSITLPAKLTTIGGSAFVWCKKLSDITIVSSVTTIGEDAFAWCTSLVNYVVASDNNRYTTDGGVLFSKNKTTLVSYPYGKTDSVYTAPSSVTSIANNAFISCEALRFVTLPDSLLTIGDKAFFGCKAIEQINLPGKLSSIGKTAFYGCSSLAEIVIPDSMTVIAENTFKNCTALKNAVIGGLRGNILFPLSSLLSVHAIHKAKKGCPALVC